MGPYIYTFLFPIICHYETNRGEGVEYNESPLNFHLQMLSTEATLLNHSRCLQLHHIEPNCWPCVPFRLYSNESSISSSHVKLLIFKFSMNSMVLKNKKKKKT
jgi:hypothetical protein